jgi:hypothetical protein
MGSIFRLKNLVLEPQELIHWKIDFIGWWQLKMGTDKTK